MREVDAVVLHELFTDLPETVPLRVEALDRLDRVLLSRGGLQLPMPTPPKPKRKGPTQVAASGAPGCGRSTV